VVVTVEWRGRARRSLARDESVRPRRRYGRHTSERASGDARAGTEAGTSAGSQAARACAASSGINKCGNDRAASFGIAGAISQRIERRRLASVCALRLRRRDNRRDTADQRTRTWWFGRAS